jgi:hypothetical protein
VSPSLCVTVILHEQLRARQSNESGIVEEAAIENKVQANIDSLVRVDTASGMKPCIRSASRQP